MRLLMYINLVDLLFLFFYFTHNKNEPYLLQGRSTVKIHNLP